MVKIDDEYLINANDSCYTLEKKSTIEDTESQNYGRETKTIQGYYTTIESALNGYIKVKTRKYISKDTENNIKELLNEIKNLKEYLKETIGG
mgnify:CR=1 FL=1